MPVAPRRRNPLRRVPFLNIISAIIHSAHRVANRLFVQDGGVRINDPLVLRVQLFRSVLGLLATLALAFFYGKGEEVWNGAASDGFGNLIITPVLLIVTGPLVVLAVIVWGLPFLFFASLHSAKTAFNTAHVHPMLPGVLTAVLVWAVAVFNLIDQGMPEGPVAAQLCSLLGGPLSVTAVSLWELRRMRIRHGVVVRG